MPEVIIKYRVDTSELNKAQSAAAAAQQATDKLRQSSEQAGAGAQKGYQQAGNEAKKFGSSLEFLKIKQAQLKASIELTNQSEKARLESLSAQYKAVSKEIDDVTKKYLKLNKTVADGSKEQKGANAEQNKGLEGLVGLAQAARGFIAVGLVKELVSSGLEAAKLSGTVETVGLAFARQIPNAAILLQDLKRATHGTVTELDLMQRTLQAKNLGIAVESLPKLLEFAAVRAQQTGVSVDYLVNSIVSGIGRKSPLILDNLGISAIRLKEEFNGASLAAQSVGDVTAAVAKIAEEEMKKMGGFVANSATQVDQLSVSYHELGVEISKTFGGSGIAGFLKDYTDSFEALFESINRGISVQELYADRSRKTDAATTASKFINDLSKKSKDDQIKAIEAEIEALDKSITTKAKYIEIEKENQRVLQNQYEDNRTIAIEQSIALSKKLVDISRDEALFQTETARLLRAKVDSLKVINTEQEEQLGLIQKQQDLIKTIQDEKTAATEEKEIADLNQELQDEQKELERLNNLGIERNGIIQKLRDRIKELNEEQEKSTSVSDINRINSELEKTNAELSALLGNGKLVTKMFSEIRKELDNTKIIEGLFPKEKGATEALSKDFIDGIKSRLDDALKTASTGEGGLNLEVGVTPVVESDGWDRLAEEFAKHRNDLISTGIFSVTDVITAGLQAEADAYDQRLSQLKDYYDQQIAYAGDNEQAKDRIRQQEQKKERKLRLEAFEADKEYKRKTTLINGAAAVINAFATLPYPAAIVASLAIAAETLSQVAVINKQQPRFQKGVINLQGPGTATSDSIQARLSKGESVMTAAETRGSFHVLKAVRAGRLNDEVMKEIVRGSTGGSQFIGQTFDASPIVREIRELRRAQPNYANDYGVLSETRQVSETFKRKARSKSMSI